MKSSVEVPNNNTDLINTMPEIQNISIRATVDPEILKFTQTGANYGNMSINIQMQYAWSNTSFYNATATISHNASVEELQAALKTFYSFSNFSCIITRDVFDVNGARSAVTGLPEYQWVWTVTIMRSRNMSSNSSITENI
jgi:hypothetical protein